MKKEALFAIIIGVLLGLGITYGIYQFRQRSSASTQTAETAEVTPQPTPATEKLLITSPKDGAVLSETKIRLSGTAESDEKIVIFVNDKEYITQADDIGAFAQEIELDTGGNVIEVTAINATGGQKVQKFEVVVSTASLDEEAPVASDEASVEPTATPAKKAVATPKATAAPTKKPTATPKETTEQ